MIMLCYGYVMNFMYVKRDRSVVIMYVHNFMVVVNVRIVEENLPLILKSFMVILSKVIFAGF